MPSSPKEPLCYIIFWRNLPCSVKPPWVSNVHSDTFSAGIAEIAEAIEKDEDIHRKHAQTMFVGPGGSGKSSLMYRLTHRKQPVYTSTGVADAVAIVDVDVHPTPFCSVAVLDSKNWKVVEFDKSLIDQMQETVRSLQQQQSDTKLSKVSPTPSTKSSSSPALKSAFSVSHTTAGVNKAVVKAAKPATASGDIKKVIFSAATKHGGFMSFQNLLKKKFSLYLRDAGGQVEFQEMVALLVFGPSIFIFVFRADQDFKSTFAVGYRRSASESINCYTSSITTEEALLQCLASVYAMDTPDKASHHAHNPYVFIVATHKDKLGQSADQKLLQLNDYLKSLIRESGFEHLVQYADRAKGQVMFAVDNTSESDEDFEVIRSRVHDLIINREEFTIQYPLAYLLFCLELQSDQRSILTLEECRTIAAKYKIVGDQVRRYTYVPTLITQGKTSIFYVCYVHFCRCMIFSTFSTSESVSSILSISRV